MDRQSAPCTGWLRAGRPGAGMGGGRKLQEAGLGKGRDWQKQRESRVADGTLQG